MQVKHIQLIGLLFSLCLRYTPEGLTVCGEPSRGELLTWLLTGSRDWHCPTSGTFCDAAEGMRS